MKTPTQDVSQEEVLHPLLRFEDQGSERAKQLPEVTQQQGLAEGRTPYSLLKQRCRGGLSATVNPQGLIPKGYSLCHSCTSLSLACLIPKGERDSL